ncbi:MAG: ATP-binding protein [Lachnospiraceae bacterium]|nr:ATP-binding protein [Lachnospiraceae bacterium]
MTKPITIGIEYYKEMIDKDYYYVDKTLLIRDILDAGAKVSLFSRPRRFGKTLALNMLKTFFEDERGSDGQKVDNRCYFERKKIEACGEKYWAKQGKYPVISLTLKEAGRPDYEQAYASLRDTIIEEFRRYRYVLQSDVLHEEERREFQAILNKNAAESDYARSLLFLSQCLKKYHGSNVIILLDEYDVPLEKSYFGKFYDRMVGFIRTFFGAALKTNDVLEFAVVTGCLRISKESIFTGLNNLRVFSLLSDDCAEAFGFTQQEVRTMLIDYGMGDRIEEVKEWYNGYLFGSTEVYNPWSILYYVEENRHKTSFFPKSYWANTSSNSIVKTLIEKADSAVRTEIEQLVDGRTITKPVYEDITYEDIYQSEDNLWNFLFFTGYLKKVGEELKGNQIYLQLAIPNREIRSIYCRAFFTWFQEGVKKSDWTDLYQAVLTGDCAALEARLKRQLTTSISFYDEAEQFYHGFMVGVLGGLSGYDVFSNRESGDGRPDIVMAPHDEEGTVLIFEFKKTDKFGQMQAQCEAALAQIEEKQYDAEYRENGYRKFIKYGICFCRKSCKAKAVMEME